MILRSIVGKMLGACAILWLGMLLGFATGCALPTEPHMQRYNWNDSVGWIADARGAYRYDGVEYIWTR